MRELWAKSSELVPFPRCMSLIRMSFSVLDRERAFVWVLGAGVIVGEFSEFILP